MRRKTGTLIPIEIDILETAIDLRKRGTRSFHGYSLAKEIQTGTGRKLLTSHGTLYRALHRLEEAGLIESFWEDASHSELEGRPRRRLYRTTGLASRELSRAHAEGASVKSRRLKPRLGTS